MYPYPIYPIPYVRIPVIPAHMYYPHEVRPYPEVDTTKLKQSVKTYESLLKDSQMISKSFIESQNLRTKIMRAAQKSNHDTVVKLIKETGVSYPFEVSYNPDSMRVTIIDEEEEPTTKLIMALRW